MATQNDMPATIKSIAALIRLAKEEARVPCVLMLGAGASISSGVLPTDKIVEDILEKYGQDLREGTLWDRFDQFWETTDPNKRDLLLKSYLDKKPSSGYQYLAELIRQGFFKKIITLNFDRLLVTALRDIGLKEHQDFGVVTRSECTTDEAVVQAMGMTDPPVKILEMHAGLSSQGTLLFSRKEMFAYPTAIESLLINLTKDDVLTVGCAFKDLCIVRAFATQGGKVYCVNPGGAPEYLDPIVDWRHSRRFVIDGEYGEFDRFFEELCGDLTMPTVLQVPKINPFKFLGNYASEEHPWFYGRKRERKEAMELLFGGSPARVIHVLGPPKAGKTSFIRAGLLPYLDQGQVLSIYLRCPTGVPLETWMPAAIAKAKPLGSQKNESLQGTIQRLARSPVKQVVVVLDDFDHLLRQYPETEEGPEKLLRSLIELTGTCKNLSCVCVGEDQKIYSRAVRHTKQDSIDLDPFEPKTIGAIVRLLGKRAGIKFDRRVIRAIMQRCEATKEDKHPFTMAHVQALCNLLADTTQVDLSHYKDVMEKEGEALTAALNVEEFLSLLEQIPDEKGRNLLRKVMKVIPRESKRILAEYVKQHFSELFAAEEPVEGVDTGVTPGAGRVATHV